MKSVTLVFPGQGSQYVGMGKNFEPHLTELFHKADSILKYPFSNLCFEGPMEDLKLTANTQPAILTHSMALFTKLQGILEAKNIKIDRVLGHSV
jgi:[acyl-carrier-protein] S-malonyltransferase